MPRPFSFPNKVATPPFLTPEQAQMMAQNLPPFEEAPPALVPPQRGGTSRPPPPPPEIMGPPGGLPDPTMMTQRPPAPERPMPEGYQKWKESEDLLNSIQGQRPRLEDNKPSFWNKLAGGIAGGLGGYMATSPSAASRQVAPQAFALAPKLLRPGYEEKMKSWGQDMESAADRAKRAKAGLGTEMDIEDSRSNQDYKAAAADYQRQLPGLAREKAEAGMIEVTPEAVAQLGLPEDWLGLKVPRQVVEKFRTSKDFAAKRDNDYKMLQDKLASTEKLNQELLDSREQEGERNRKSAESRAKTTAGARVTAAGIGANKSKGQAEGRPKKIGDKYYAQVFDKDSGSYKVAMDEDGEMIEVAPPRKPEESLDLPDSLKPKTEAKPTPAPAPAPAAPAQAAKAGAKSEAKVLTEAQLKTYIDRVNKTREKPISRADAIRAAKAKGYDTSKIK